MLYSVRVRVKVLYRTDACYRTETMERDKKDEDKKRRTKTKKQEEEEEERSGDLDNKSKF